MRFAMSFLMSLVLDVVLSDPGSVIPTKEEQANLLKNVEEVFSEVKVMVSDEGGATDAAVIGDVRKMVQRGLDYFSLLEESSLRKLSCAHGEALKLKELQPKIRETVDEGKFYLEECVHESSNTIYVNSKNVTNTMRVAMNQGQVLLDTLNRCSSKAGLAQISCYKNIITADVFPLKLILLDAIQMHKLGHLEAIAIRNRANECVDDALNAYRNRIVQILEGVADL